MDAVSVSELNKIFRIFPSRWSRLKNWFGLTHEISFNSKEALRDIVFNLPRGSSTAFIGANGAGKSTLLKIVAGIICSTTGHLRVSGTISALLELGIGFHPELTGRENIYRTGLLLGFTKTELTRHFDEIISFAEIGHYINEPLRTYSSGMQARLAFSIATAIRPDIFLIDETLSVGDAYFHHKSFQRMKLFRAQGTTILFVSHEKETVLSMCDHAVLLVAGRILGQGKPQAMLDLYNALSAASIQSNLRIQQIALPNGQIQIISGNRQAQVSRVAFLNHPDGIEINQIATGQLVTLQIQMTAHARLSSLNLGFGIKNSDGILMFGTNSYLMGQELLNLPSGQSALFEFKFRMNLAPGIYSLSTALVGGKSHIENNYEWKDFAHQFEVTGIKKSSLNGPVWLPPISENYL